MNDKPNYSVLYYYYYDYYFIRVKRSCLCPRYHTASRYIYIYFFLYNIMYLTNGTFFMFHPKKLQRTDALIFKVNVIHVLTCIQAPSSN